jgi:hypothetical protein
MIRREFMNIIWDSISMILGIEKKEFSESPLVTFKEFLLYLSSMHVLYSVSSLSSQ